MPVRVIITKGTRADCKEAKALIKNFSAQFLLADRGYDTDEIIAEAKNAKMCPVIPPKRNRVFKRKYDKYLYKLRHLVENAFLHIKGWRGLATRYAKNLDSFISTVQIRCIAMWLKIL